MVAHAIPTSGINRGVSFQLMQRTISPDIDEKAIRNPAAHKLVLEIAEAKAKRVLEILAEEKAKGASSATGG